MNALDKILKMECTFKVDFIYLRAYINNVLVGTLNFQILCDNKCNLYGLYVEPSWRRKGIAYKLNVFAIEEMKKLDKNLAAVASSSNDYVTKILLKLGYGFVDLTYRKLFFKEIG